MLMRPRAVLAAASLLSGLAQAAPHLALDVQLNPESRTLRVEAELRDVRIERFELHETLEVIRASVDGNPVTPQAAPAKRGVREWRLPQPAAKLRLSYSGTLAPLAQNADHRRVLRALPPMASVEGSFLASASAWYPPPTQLFTYRVRLSLPAGQRGLVAGELVDERVEASGAAIATFEMRHPTDGVDLMAGPYVVSERVIERKDDGPLRLRTYFTPAIASLADGYLEDSARYIERYSKSIGAYPFGSFSVVASPLPTGFGMPTLTYIGEAVLRLPFIRASSLGHEVLHNWWGNGVYVDYASGNWAEGLTTFMADYAYKEDASAGAASEMRLGWLRDLAALPPGAAQPLTAFRSRAHGADAATGYGKAAMLFVMLRDLIGAAAFEDGIRRFWNAHRYRTASWGDLRAAFESASGRDLSIFFAQWLEGAGAPALRIVSARASGASIEVRLEQSVPPYALRVPLVFDGPAGSTVRFVDISQNSQTVRVDDVGAVTSVRVDPDLRLWRALDPKTLPPILRQWILAASPRYAVVSDALSSAAENLAKRLFEQPARRVDPADSADAPLLIVGTHTDVDAALARLALPPRPAEVAGRGSAQVWTIPRAPDRMPIAVISVLDAASVASLARPLPHYGAQSYLAFEGRRAVARGVWPVRSPLTAIAR